MVETHLETMEEPRLETAEEPPVITEEIIAAFTEAANKEYVDALLCDISSNCVFGLRTQEQEAILSMCNDPSGTIITAIVKNLNEVRTENPYELKVVEGIYRALKHMRMQPNMRLTAIIRYIFYAFAKAGILRNDGEEALDARMIKVMLALDSIYETIPIPSRCCF